MAKIKDYIIQKNERRNKSIDFLEKEREYLESRKQDHGKDIKDTIKDRQAE